MNRDILIGGAWPYANYYMHIGHAAALLPGDVLARYFRANGDRVVYVSGSDCHGTPITVKAKAAGVEPSEIAEKFHKADVETFKNLGFDYDLYTNTMDPFHEARVQEYLKQIKENGFLYEKEEMEDYCPVCKQYLADREIIGKCPHCGGEAKGDQCEVCAMALNADEVLDKRCAACGHEVEKKSNKHYYFALSKFQPEIKKLVDLNSKVWRFNAVRETEKFLNMGLIDRAVTRQIEWGIRVPFEGYDDKRIYVWMEAVMGYLTTAEQVCKAKGIDFYSFITNPQLTSYYVHGKDNIPFHTVIYSALLQAIDRKYNLPGYIVSSEYVNINNEKMSKSKGNLITADELLEIFPADSVRYYLTAFGPEKKDISTSLDEMKQAHNKFLVGQLGNFINRNLSFLSKKFEGVIPNGVVDEDIIAKTKETFKVVGELIEKAELKSALNEVFDYIALGNKYYDEHEPWNQVKNDIEAFNNTTYTCVYMMANIANLIAPFMPTASAKIKAKLGVDKEVKWAEVSIPRDLKVQDNDLLFNRILDENK